MNYFEGVPDSKMKDKYRQYCSSLHPDKGGDTAKFQEMKQQYENWEKYGTTGQHRGTPHHPTTHDSTGRLYKAKNGRLFQIIADGWIAITPFELKRGYTRFRAGGDMWTIYANDIVGGTSQVILDTENETCVRYTPRFEVGELTGMVTISDLDIIRRNRITVRLFSDGVHFANYQITDHNSFEQFLTGRDKSEIGCSYKCAKISEILIRPDVKWIFKRSVFKVDVTIITLDWRTHMMDAKVEKKTFMERLRISFKYLFGG